MKLRTRALDTNVRKKKLIKEKNNIFLYGQKKKIKELGK